MEENPAYKIHCQSVSMPHDDPQFLCGKLSKPSISSVLINLDKYKLCVPARAYAFLRVK